MDLRDGPVRGHIRTAGFLRVSHGLFRPDGGIQDLESTEQFRLDLAAWLLVLPPGAAFTHVTGGRLLGWQLPKLPEQVPVFAAVAEADNRPRRPGLLCSRLVHPRETGHAHGLPVDPAHEILLRAARDLGLLDLVIMIDSARRLRHVDSDAMERLLQSRRPGVRILRQAWRMSTAKAASAGETLLRMFDRAIEVDVEPQARLHDEAGNLVGVVDLAVVGTDLVHEYDGAHHRRSRQHRVDLRRDRGLSGASYRRRGYTLDDLLNHSAVVMHEVDRDLGRAHDGRRLERWRRLVAGSLYDEVVRRRVMNRWQRAMGVTEWA